MKRRDLIKLATVSKEAEEEVMTMHALLKKLSKDELKSVGRAVDLIKDEKMEDEARAILTQCTEGVITRAKAFKEIDKLWSCSR